MVTANKKTSSFIERLAKKEVEEKEILFQFRFPESWAKQLKKALEQRGLKPRDIFAAAAEELIENMREEKAPKEDSVSRARSILSKGASR